jgi:methionine synthase / methylenetetrahydrofolate reductase(NADPH)
LNTNLNGATELSAICLKPSRTLVCLEVNPPRGVELQHIFDRLDGNLEGVDYLNVTDSALARMKLAALPFASLLKQRYGKEVMVNISCRDRNLLALQSDLLAGWATGVRTVVALTGDAMTIGDSPERKGVFEVNSIGLLNVIKTLNEGRDLAGNELKGKPGYLPGVVVNPNVRNPGAELRRLRKKVEGGAAYALSQPVFDEQASVSFFQQAVEVGIPIFMGLLPLKSAKSALAINNIPGIRLPESLVAEVQDSGDKDLSRFFLDRCLRLAELNRPYVCGFHVVSGITPLLALQLARELAEYVRR